jgi:hypothetical protein
VLVEDLRVGVQKLALAQARDEEARRVLVDLLQFELHLVQVLHRARVVVVVVRRQHRGGQPLQLRRIERQRLDVVPAGLHWCGRGRQGLAPGGSERRSEQHAGGGTTGDPEHIASPR